MGPSSPSRLASKHVDYQMRPVACLRVCLPLSANVRTCYRVLLHSMRTRLNCWPANALCVISRALNSCLHDCVDARLFTYYVTIVSIRTSKSNHGWWSLCKGTFCLCFSLYNVPIGIVCHPYGRRTLFEIYSGYLFVTVLCALSPKSRLHNTLWIPLIDPKLDC